MHIWGSHCVIFGNFDFYFNKIPLNIESLDISRLELTTLPDLSRFTNLKTLNCSHNKLTSLFPLNPFLKTLHCEFNNLISLPLLNNSLHYLYCSDNQLTSLPPLNDSLQYLYCSNNLLKSLPPLNPSLKSLNCSSNHLKSLPSLNDSLQYLYCSNNHLKSLPPLNPFLKTLHCEFNNLISLPSLNNSLQYLHCSYNKLNHLPYLPFDLIIYIYNNPIYIYIYELDFIDSNNQVTILNKITHFKDFYFLSKFKKKFISWLWKSREKKIQEKFHFKYLDEVIKKNESNPDFNLDDFIDKWIND